MNDLLDSDVFDPDAPAAEGSGIFGLSFGRAQAKVVLVPVPFEATVSFGEGTAKGPELILDASGQVDLFDLETGHPYEAGIFMEPISQEILELSATARRDALAGEIERVNEASAQMNAFTRAQVLAALEEGKIVGTIGGDHSIALGAIQAHAERFGPLGVLHFDAHADLRVAYEGFTWSHASVMERALAEAPIERLVQVGIRDLGRAEHQRTQEDPRVQTFFDPQLSRARLSGQLLGLFEQIVDALPQRVYCSFDIDGLRPDLCPGTGTPVPGGLDLAEASLLLGMVVGSGRRLLGFDLCEVAGSAWDGNVGARVLYKLIGWSLRTELGADRRSASA